MQSVGRHILLKGVPRTVTVSDVRRAVNSTRAEGIESIAREYYYFKPTEKTYLTLTSREFLNTNLFALKNLSIGGKKIDAQASFGPVDVRAMRTRGAQGREKAADRGFYTGNGLHAGLSTKSNQHVTVWGLPGRLDPSELLARLGGYNIANDKMPIVKSEVPPRQFSLYSRFLVCLADTTEAHRLVRDLHLKYWDVDKLFQIHARVLYVA